MDSGDLVLCVLACIIFLIIIPAIIPLVVIVGGLAIFFAICRALSGPV